MSRTKTAPSEKTDYRTELRPSLACRQAGSGGQEMNAVEGKRELAAVAVELDKIRGALARIAEGLGDNWPEKMAAGKMPPSVSYGLRQLADTLLEDHIRPAVILARGAALLNRQRIRDDWREWRAQRAAEPADVVHGAEQAMMAAQVLGGGDGMQKLCYVLHLGRFDDKTAERVADYAAFIVAGDLIKDKGSETDKTDDERMVLMKAARLESVRCQDHVDRAMLRRIDEGKRRELMEREPPEPTEPLKFLLAPLAVQVVMLRDTADLYTQAGEAGFDLGTVPETLRAFVRELEALPDVAKALDDLEVGEDDAEVLDVPEDDDGGPSYIGRALRIARELRGRQDDD